MTDFQCLCPNCGNVKTYTEKVKARNRETNCLPCSRKLRHKAKGRFERVCDTCGDIKISDRPIRPTTCLTCSQKRIGSILVMSRSKESYGGKTTYSYFCRYCSSVRVLSSKRKTSTCSYCSRRHEQKKKMSQIYFDLSIMQYIIPLIQSKALKKKASKKKALKKSVKSVSRTIIDNKIELNRVHRKAQVRYESKKVIQARTDEQMIAEFLATNKMTKVEQTQMSDVYIGEVNIKGY